MISISVLSLFEICARNDDNSQKMVGFTIIEVIPLSTIIFYQAVTAMNSHVARILKILNKHEWGLFQVFTQSS